MDLVEENHAVFNNLFKSTYVVRVRAKNPWDCSTRYSGYATSEEVTTITE